MAARALVHYFDYKSPYAYLAQAATAAVARETGATLRLVPITLRVADYLGWAELDEQGRVLAEQRNGHQWRRIRYMFMDCRREAARQGLVIRSPRRMVDSDLAHLGFLYAGTRGDPGGYHARVFAGFHGRTLDIEDAAAIGATLAESGIDPGGFAAYVQGPGPEALARLREEAEAQGVFGTPSYVVDGELYWGAERLPRVRERLLAT